jgi:hypothetical protein
MFPTLIQSLMIADEIRNQYPDLAKKVNGRLEAAVNIAASGGIAWVEMTDAIYTVPSESNPAGSYRVDLAAHACTCPDHGKHGAAGIVCKHRLAAHIVRKFGERCPVVKPWPAPGDDALVVYYPPMLGPCLIECTITAHNGNRFTVEAKRGLPFDDKTLRCSSATVQRSAIYRDLADFKKAVAGNAANLASAIKAPELLTAARQFEAARA